MRIEEITLVVPTRNEERNIGAFLASLPQALPIIVVDASEDRTPEIVTAARRPACTLVRRPANVSEARQLGTDLATTLWLLFTDADVELPPDYFERLGRHSDCHALYGPKLSRDAFRRYYLGFALAQRIAHRLGVPAASGSNLLVRRQVLESIGWLRPRAVLQRGLGARLAHQTRRLPSRFRPRAPGLRHRPPPSAPRGVAQDGAFALALPAPLSGPHALALARARLGLLVHSFAK